MPKRIRVLLSEDHKMVRKGFGLILAGQADMEVVGETGSGAEAVELARQLEPDVVLMDVTLADLNGIEATRRIRAFSPRIRILALSVHRDSVYVREMIRAGADGYLLKESADTDLVAAVRQVAAGQGYLSPEVAGAVLSDYRRHVASPLDLLSAREREILQLIAEGRTSKEIATKLNLSVYTVDGYRTRIMEKLDLHSVGELVRFGLRHGLID